MRNRGHRVVFMGSPVFSLPILQALFDHFDVVGVVTQPDRPKGRGKREVSPPVKELAERLAVPVIQPSRLRKDVESKAVLASWQPDVIVVAAFGQILRPDILSMPPFGCVNVHTSLLPRWRGASPIESAILSGDQATGVTIMRMDAGLDTGPIISQCSMDILPNWRSSELEAEMARQGAALLIETLPQYLSGEISPIAQSEEGVTYAPMIKKEDGFLDYHKPVEVLLRQIRAYHPWPGTFIMVQGQSIKILRASSRPKGDVDSGYRTVIENKPAFASADGWLLCEEVQPAGKNPMTGEVFLRGYHHKWLEEKD